MIEPVETKDLPTRRHTASFEVFRTINALILTYLSLYNTIQACHMIFMVVYMQSTGIKHSLGSLQEVSPHIEELTMLISTGADIYEELNFKTSINKNEDPKSLFELLLQETNCPDFDLVSENLSTEQISKNLPKFYKVLQHILLSKNSNAISNIVTLFEKHKDLPATTHCLSFLSGLILLNEFYQKKSHLSAQGTKIVERNLRHLSDIMIKKLTLTTEEKETNELFSFCLTQPNSMHKWIKKYPDSIHWQSIIHNKQDVLFDLLPFDQAHFFAMKMLRSKQSKAFISLREFDIQGRNSSNTWSAFAYKILTMGTFNHLLLHKNSSLNLLYERKGAYRWPQLDTKILCDISAMSFKCFVGRTIIFEDKSHNLIALKVQKKGESYNTLQAEYNTVEFLNKQKVELGLQSGLPQAVACGLIRREEVNNYIPTNVDTTLFKKLVFDYESTIGLYVYKIAAKDKSYFTYLHETCLSEEEFNKANRIAINDLFMLLKKEGMVFHQLGDIFHDHSGNNRTDAGRYLVLTSLLRRSFYSSQKYGKPGDIQNWQNAIQFVNLRGSGLADLGDFKTIHDYAKSDHFIEINDSCESEHQVYEDADPNAMNFIYANIIAEYLLILTLICGKRGFELTEDHQLSSDEKNGIWLSLANTMINNAAQAISILTEISEEIAKQYIASIIDVEQLSQQMAYWMTTEYVNDLQGNFGNYKKKLEQLYKQTIILSYNSETPVVFKQLLADIGFSQDGIHQDLGDDGRENPLHEANKLFYMVPCLILIFQNMHNNFNYALTAFKEHMAMENFELARIDLEQLRLNREPANVEEKTIFKRCKTELFSNAIAIQKVGIYQKSPNSEDNRLVENAYSLSKTS